MRIYKKNRNLEITKKPMPTIRSRWLKFLEHLMKKECLENLTPTLKTHEAEENSEYLI